MAGLLNVVFTPPEVAFEHEAVVELGLLHGLPVQQQLSVGVEAHNQSQHHHHVAVVLEEYQVLEGTGP